MRSFDINDPLTMAMDLDTHALSFVRACFIYGTATSQALFDLYSNDPVIFDKSPETKTIETLVRLEADKWLIYQHKNEHGNHVFTANYKSELAQLGLSTHWPICECGATDARIKQINYRAWLKCFECKRACAYIDWIARKQSVLLVNERKPARPSIMPDMSKKAPVKPEKKPKSKPADDKQKKLF